MNQIKSMVFAAVVALVGPNVHAQTQAAGLWEHSMVTKSDDDKMNKAMADMQKQMAAMPPEQRKQMESMMASRGVKMSTDGSGATTVKVCISKEEAAKLPEARMNLGQCVQKDIQRSGNTMKFKYECTQPPSTGEGEVTFISDKAYSGKTLMTSQQGGKPQQMTMSMQGKWLSADCGSVKPSPSLPAK